MINNLHEYSVVIIDLQNENETRCCVEDDEPDGIPYLYELSFPQKEFVPSPLVLNVIKNEMRVPSLKIIFSSLLTALRTKGIITTDSSNQQISNWILVGDDKNQTRNKADSIKIQSRYNENSIKQLDQVVLGDTNGGYIVIGVKEKNGMPVFPLEGVPKENLDSI
jgi:hypothetical protein